MPLFSKGKNGDDEDVSHRETPREAPNGEQQPPPDEYTRLLPNRVDSNGGFLNPDDPAVSPYNLWSIRALRLFTVFFTAMTFVWWVILLASAFATPPGFSTRGSCFFAFSYASLTLANMLFALIFFRVPSKAERILAIVMAVLLALDMTLILSVQKTRYEEGWVGIVSVIGRAETRRTLTEWVAVLLTTIGHVIMVIAVVLITLTIILRALDAGLAPPGKLYWVDGDKYQIHLYCNGNRTNENGKKVTTVLFEGGEWPVENSLWSFADNAVNNGSISRYCFADRPGMAWSDTAPSPSSAGFIVDALSEALAKAGEEGPWVLASTGVGTLYSRIFSVRHGHDVQGLLLIDPLHEDLLGPAGSPGRGFLLWLRGVISPLGLDRIPGAIFRRRTSSDRIYGRSAPQTGKFIFAKLQENLVLNSFTKRDVESSRQIQEKGTPLVVVSSGQEVKNSDLWAKKQRDLTGLTDKLENWDIVDEAPHEVWRTLEGRDKIEKRLKQLVRR